MQSNQFRLVIQQVDSRGTAILKQKDDLLGVRSNVR